MNEFMIYTVSVCVCVCAVCAGVRVHVPEMVFICIMFALDSIQFEF